MYTRLGFEIILDQPVDVVHGVGRGDGRLAPGALSGTLRHRVAGTALNGRRNGRTLAAAGNDSHLDPLTRLTASTPTHILYAYFCISYTDFRYTVGQNVRAEIQATI